MAPAMWFAEQPLTLSGVGALSLPLLRCGALRFTHLMFFYDHELLLHMSIQLCRTPPSMKHGKGDVLLCKVHTGVRSCTLHSLVHKLSVSSISVHTSFEKGACPSFPFVLYQTLCTLHVKHVSGPPPQSTRPRLLTHENLVSYWLCLNEAQRRQRGR